MTATALWTSAEAAAATGGLATADWTATGIAIDSRTIAPGELFVAIRGPNFDGHDFVARAFEAGAAAAVVAGCFDASAAAGPLLVVDDTLAALEAMGRQRRAEVEGRIVAITGSVGKTGTKEALARVLAGEGRVHASASSLNNHWGVPLSLARMPRGTDFGIFELGMNNPGEIARLTAMVRPSLALITAIQPAHMAVFDTLADIARAKAEIFEALEPGGAAVLCRDTPHFDILEAAAKAAGAGTILGFGEDARADVRLLRMVERADGIAVSAEVAGRPITYDIGAPGRHWAVNSLAVLATVTALGADLSRATGALAEVGPLVGRGRQHVVACRGGSLRVIDESYNANPASMRAAFEVLGRAAPGPGGRRVAVLGDMLELGEQAEALHVGLAEAIVEREVDVVFACGPCMASMLAALPAARRGAWAETSAELLPLVADAVRAGDVVTVKGSLGMAMAPIVAALLELNGDVGPVAATA
ncbi:MAG: UDP-N-acetylmuramoylalanyl-D-glutamyl-2,6-diaminopimelate--D-alanyl-D-alanine ligase [Alphaproteobacteria bacterium]|jgi:UDP-N-acetylmuramoyl-tripeptide--D-alanyl-D-alanine ligase|nr:UDP-N-acetylmuramoylalanyl-D-glutamyl-2,6-diaminopimelate--D-alanyl-D-alanine ligase [Alphaproteobacteria bacterium]